MIPIYDNNKVSRPPKATRFLIWCNVFALLLTLWYESSGVSWVTAAYGLVPSRLSADPKFESIKLLTSMFLHAGFWHMAWNLWFLHIFGDNVEDALGRARYLGFYLVSGIAAGLTQYFINPLSQVPMVGASGAIAGVLGAYLVLYPRVPVSILNPVILVWPLLGPFFVVPAWLVFAVWFFGNAVGGLTSLGSNQGGVAFFAHLGGFLFGLLAIRPLAGARAQERNRTNAEAGPIRGRKIFWKESSGPFWK